MQAINESIKKIVTELQKISTALETITRESEPPSDDILYPELKKLARQQKTISASLIQRRLRIGYARAANLLDRLADDGIIGPAEGASPRKVIK